MLDPRSNYMAPHTILQYLNNFRADCNSLEPTQQTFVLMKTSSKPLDQDELIRLSHTSSRRLHDVSIKTTIFVLAIRLQDVLQTFSRVFKTSCQDVFKTPCINFFKTSSRHLQDVFKASSRHLQDVFKTNHQVKNFP